MSQAARTLPVPTVKVEEQFVRLDDGTGLYVCSEGQGPALVLSNGLGVSTFFWNHVRASFAGQYRVVTWDYRGHGKSGPAPSTGFGIRTCAEDLLRVMDHLGIEDAVLAGHSLGSQTILETYRMAPERVLGLVPTLGGYGRTVESFMDTKLSLPALKVLRKVAMASPRTSKLLLNRVPKLPLTWRVARAMGVVHPDLCPRAEMEPYLEHLSRLDLPTYFQLAQDLQDHDASDVLPTVKVPTLVFAGDRDLFTPMWLSERMAAAIPDSELCVIRGGSHAALVEQPELMCLRLERFLVERLDLPRMSRVPW